MRIDFTLSEVTGHSAAVTALNLAQKILSIRDVYLVGMSVDGDKSYEIKGWVSSHNSARFFNELYEAEIS